MAAPTYSLSARTESGQLDREITGGFAALANFLPDAAGMAPERSSGNTKREQAGALTQLRTPSGLGAVLNRTLWSNLAVKTVNTHTTAASIVDATGYGNLTIPAAELVVGAAFELEVSGLISTFSSGTFILSVKAGAAGTTVVVANAAITPVASQTDDVFVAKVRFQVLTAGVSGKIIASGMVVLEQSTRKVAKLVTAAAGASVDLSVDNILDVTATWSVSDVTNSVSVLNASLKRVR